MSLYQDTMATQRYCGASRSHVAFLRQSGIFLFPSYCLLEAKNARWYWWSHEIQTKTTRFDKMASRQPYDAQKWHTNSTWKWSFAMSSSNFLACQIFTLTKLLPEKLSRGSYDSTRCSHEWPDVITIRSKFEHFLIRVSIWCQFRDSVTPA